MPTILDNIERALLPALQGMLRVSQWADFYVGYFNLRGWKCIDSLVEAWGGGPGAQARVLAMRRNGFVAELADALFVAYAEPGGNTERVSREALQAGKPVFTFGDPANEGLVGWGAQPVLEGWRWGG